jgi:hypothetical protein
MAAIESFERIGVGRQKARDPILGFRPGVAGPLQHFPAEPASPDDENPLAVGGQ